MIRELTHTSFDETIKEGLVLVDFWAPWCGPCRMIAPTLEQIATEFEGKALITKVNVDQESDLATKYGIRHVPTLLLMKDGEILETILGANTKASIEEKLNKYL